MLLGLILWPFTLWPVISILTRESDILILLIRVSPGMRLHATFMPIGMGFFVLLGYGLVWPTLCTDHSILLSFALFVFAPTLKHMASQAGLEPATCGLEVRYSIQLSYWETLVTLPMRKSLLVFFL